MAQDAGVALHFETHRDRLKSDVIVVCDTENIEVGIPSITYSLRGIVAVRVDVTTAKIPVHSGMGGGALPAGGLFPVGGPAGRAAPGSSDPGQ